MYYVCTTMYVPKSFTRSFSWFCSQTMALEYSHYSSPCWQTLGKILKKKVAKPLPRRGRYNSMPSSVLLSFPLKTTWKPATDQKIKYQRTASAPVPRNRASPAIEDNILGISRILPSFLSPMSPRPLPFLLPSSRRRRTGRNSSCVGA